MTVIGLDLSLTASGMSDGAKTWVHKSKGQKSDSLRQRWDRLRGLTDTIVGSCMFAGLVVIEQPAYASNSGHMHDRSGLWWLVLDGLACSGTPVVEVAPSQLKKYATGKGNAAKGLVLDATARRLPDIDTGADDNRADALWLACMGLDHLGTPVVDLPAAQRAVLDAVTWPEP